MRVESFEQLLRLYATGERDFSGSELDEDPHNNMDGVQLDGINLSDSCVMATFRGASLRGAHFRVANVKTCDFSGADLRDADFRGAGLCATDFRGANIEGAKFAGAYWHSYKLKEGETPDV